MSIISALATIVQAHSHESTASSPMLSGPTADHAAPLQSSSRANDSTVATNAKPRLGDTVRHGRYGNGTVLALWPDGTLQVRFDREARIRLVWPGYLALADGKRG